MVHGEPDMLDGAEGIVHALISEDKILHYHDLISEVYLERIRRCVDAGKNAVAEETLQKLFVFARASDASPEKVAPMFDLLTDSRPAGTPSAAEMLQRYIRMEFPVLALRCSA